MGKIPAKNINFSLGGTALEDEITSIELSATQETIKVDGLSSSGPERVVGNNDHSIKIDGNFDGASGQGDATLWGMIGDADGAATAFDPTGQSAGTNDPNYDSQHVLSAYSIKGAVGAAVTYSATLEGTAAMTRSTS